LSFYITTVEIMRIDQSIVGNSTTLGVRLHVTDQ